MLRRSASAKDRLHHPREKPGNDDGRGTGEGSQAPDIRPWPGHPAPGDVNDSSSPAAQVLQAPDIRRQPRTSGASGHPGHPARSPEIRRPLSREHRGRPRQPGHPAPQPGHPDPRKGPDIRPDARTSGPPACVQCIWAEAHVPLRPLDYIYFPSTYILGLANVIAHLEIELCSSLWFFSFERPRPLRRRSTPDSRPLTGRSLADSRPPHGEEPVTLCIVLCWIWIVYLSVFRGSSTCVTASCWFE
jgi:hypothetical protein